MIVIETKLDGKVVTTRIIQEDDLAAENQAKTQAEYFIETCKNLGYEAIPNKDIYLIDNTITLHHPAYGNIITVTISYCA